MLAMQARRTCRSPTGYVFWTPTYVMSRGESKANAA